MNKTINKAVAFYRKENQIKKAVEEMADPHSKWTMAREEIESLRRKDGE